MIIWLFFKSLITKSSGQEVRRSLGVTLYKKSSRIQISLFSQTHIVFPDLLTALLTAIFKGILIMIWGYMHCAFLLLSLVADLFYPI